jgi:ArsR family transcriptional regulator, arsenate/arsenite/antimonite-responsive transcriptional repressor
MTTAARHRVSDPRPSVDQLGGLFGAFADPTRIRILNLLGAGELCVCDIVELLGLPQPTISRHLGILRQAGLIEVTRRWKFAHYRLAQPHTATHGNFTECVRSFFAGIESLAEERSAARSRVAARSKDPCP